MSNDPSMLAREDDGPEPDPVEAELIAYLDGELDPATARKVESKLAADPKLRARAEALKRSYDLLDFLPKSDPSPTFATKTLGKLPRAATSASGPAALSPTLLFDDLPAAGANPTPPAVPLPPRSARPWAWAAGVLAATGLALGAGYLGAAAVRAYVSPPAAPKEVTPDAIPLADLRAVENLPLYASADDLDFVDHLATPDFFGDELMPPDGLTPPRPIEPEKPVGQPFDQLAKAFRELPPDQQDRIRLLDRQLHELEPARRDRLFRVLAAYSAWLYRLSEPTRKSVLESPTAEKRLGVIRDVRNWQWVEGLPAKQARQLNHQLPAERAVLVAKWRAEEDLRRSDWLVTRPRHWATLQAGKPPWPFQDDKLKKEVLEFVTAAYHPDETRRCRLSAADRERLLEALKATQEAGDKAHWLPLGKVVYDFSKKAHYDMLPEPAVGKPVVAPADLAGWPAALTHFSRLNSKPKIEARIAPRIGKWPDFALEVHAEMNRPKLAGPPPSFHLGPCHPADFKEDTRRFVTELQKKLTTTQAKGLKDLEGKWPEYPRELIKLARAHDMSVPGAMPPGPPSMWEKTYNPAAKPAG